MEFNYITLKQALILYDFIIDTWGGERGLLSEEILLQCLYTPASIYYNYDQYPTLPEKAAAYIYFVITLHPFVDGNKRAGFMYAEYFLGISGHIIDVDLENAEKFLLEVADGKKSFNDVLNWVIPKITKKKT